METFIEGVRRHPCLWNPMHPDYREMHVKDDAWERVVEHYNNSSIPNIQIAKVEWKKLRDNHRDALKRAKLGKNKLLPAQITTWKYAKAMQFLEPHMKYRITEYIEDPPKTSSIKESDQDVTTSEAEQGLGTSTEAPIPSKRRYVDHTEQTPVRLRLREESDALESFFKCILKSTRDMPQWMQTQVKKKIFAVVIEAEEQLSVLEHNNKAQFANVSFESKVKSEVITDDDPEY